MYYDPGSKMYYDGYYIDSNSGVQLQLCPLPIGGLIFPCLAPLPATTTLPVPPCEAGEQFFGPRSFNGYVINGRGPQGGLSNCHVNLEAQGYPPIGVNSLNLHITYVASPDFVGGEYFANSVIPLTDTAAGAANESIRLIDAFIGDTGGALYSALAVPLEDALVQLANETP